MRISHEAIYWSLYVQGRGALRRELTARRRTGRALRVPRARTRERGNKFIMGLGSSAIGTLVERTTRFTVLLHLPRLEGHGNTPQAKHGPALAGYGPEAVRDAIVESVGKLPEHLRRSLTGDQGAEMSQRAQLGVGTGLAIYFCDPQSSWQQGTNENTNGLLRQYFPKGTDLSKHSAEDLAPSPSPSTAGHARPSVGGPQPKHSTNRYALLMKAVLRPPLEPGQYASEEYVALLSRPGTKISMSRTGNSYDNALAESFMATLKKERVHLQDYEVQESRRCPLLNGHVIEDVYNRKRLHSSLGYLPPIELEAEWTAQKLLVVGA